MSTDAGWYADPTQPDRWRWYDGTAWTDHVSTPARTPESPGPASAAPEAASVAPALAADVAPAEHAPVAPEPPTYPAPERAAPAYVVPEAAVPAYASYPPPAFPAAPAYSSTQPYPGGAYGAATGPAGQSWSGVPKRPRTTGSRLLVIAGATVAGLFGVSVLMGGVTAGLRAANRPSVAAGPTMVMDGAAPATIAGLPPSTDATVVTALDKMRRGMDSASSGLRGAQPTKVQGYAVLGQAAGLLAWIRDDEPLDQAAVIRGAKESIAEQNASPLTLAEADGASMICSASQASNGVATSSCTWVRSGTGLVTLAWAGSGDTKALAATTREAVRSLVRTAT